MIWVASWLPLDTDIARAQRARAVRRWRLVGMWFIVVGNTVMTLMFVRGLIWVGSAMWGELSK